MLPKAFIEEGPSDLEQCTGLFLPSYIRQQPFCDNRVGKPVAQFGPKWHIRGIILKAKRCTYLINKLGQAQVEGLSFKKGKS